MANTLREAPTTCQWPRLRVLSPPIAPYRAMDARQRVTAYRRERGLFLRARRL